MQEYARAAVELNRQQRDTHLDYKELCERCDVLDKALAEYEQRAQPATSAIEQIAQDWDGCIYAAPGCDIDIGEAIRTAGKRLSIQSAASAEPTRVVAWRARDGHGLPQTDWIDGSPAEDTQSAWEGGDIEFAYAAPVAAQPSTPEIPDGLKSIRDAALEEAAAAAEHVGRPVGAGDGDTYITGTSADAAKAIRALKSQPATSTQDREDAERYRWLKANIEEGYELPGAYYIDDGDTSNWDKTIDAARAAKEPNHG
jgi:hypothetical protein